MKERIVHITIIILILLAALVFGITWSSRQARKKYEKPIEKVAQVPIKIRPEQFIVAGNYYVNDTIDVLKINGWKIKSVKALNQPCNITGCYDILITYE